MQIGAISPRSLIGVAPRETCGGSYGGRATQRNTGGVRRAHPRSLVLSPDLGRQIPVRPGSLSPPDVEKIETRVGIQA